MNNTEFIYKVSPRGEGKTRWLVQRAQEELENNKDVYLFTRDCDNFKEFAENYFNHTSHICRVEHACSPYEIPDGGVVLIDDLLTENVNCLDINALNGTASKVYITLEGKQYRAYNTPDDDWEQLSIFTMMEAINA